MTSSTKNVKLGVCQAIFDGADLGYTKGGVEVEVQTESYEVKVDQFGETPIGELIQGRMVMATVPMAETTLENLLLMMPGARLVTDGAKASGTVSFSAAPTDGDTIQFGEGGVIFTWKTTPVGVYELAVPGSATEAADAFAAMVNEAPVGFVAEVSGSDVTLTARQTGTTSNMTITASNTTDITVTSPTGGVEPTRAKVVVETGTNINLLDIAKKLVLRPKGTNGEDDFTIFRAASIGSLSFSYNFDSERIFTAEFKGYATESGDLFALGNEKASA